MGGVNPVIFVVDMNLVVVLWDVRLSSLFSRDKGERRCFVLGIEGVLTGGVDMVVDVGRLRQSE